MILFLLGIVWFTCAIGAGWNAVDNPWLAVVLFVVSVAAGIYALSLT